MILTDTNLLVYAFRIESADHQTYRSWLGEVVAGGDELALHDMPLTSFVRIVTNRRIYADPSPTGIALDFVDRLISARKARWLPGSSASWSRLKQFAALDGAIAGNLVPDAFLASLATVNGCRLATADRGFARFPGLRWFDPKHSG